MLILMHIFSPLLFYPPTPVIPWLLWLHMCSTDLYCPANGDFISRQELPVPEGLHPSTNPGL